MIKFALFSLLLPVSLFVQGQTWCPPGASWGYSIHAEDRGFATVTYEKDTVINGQACVKLHTEEVMRASNARWSANSYTFERNDTAFFFYDNAFWPVYYFNAQLGDTLAYYVDDCGGTLQKQVVDSIGTIVLNNDTLKYYVASFIDDSAYYIYPYSIKVVEKFGAINNLIKPIIVCGVVCADYTLRCYTEDKYSYYASDSSFACDSVYNSVSSINEQTLLVLHPNPANNRIEVSADGINISQYTVLDYSGKEVLANTSSKGNVLSVDISHLSQGIYLLKLELANGQYAVRRFVKE